jgi:hypothetical protein
MGAAMNQTQENENPIVLIQRLHRWRMAFFGLVILLAGISIGVTATILATDYVVPPRPPGPEFAAERLITRLGNQLRLSPDQVERILPIIQLHMRSLQDIRTSAVPKITEQLILMNEEISTILREDQRYLWQRQFGRLQENFLRGPVKQAPITDRPYRRGRQQPELPPLPSREPSGNKTQTRNPNDR